MSVIPLGMAQVNLRFSGVSVPRGAQLTFGVDAGVLPTAVDVAETVTECITSSQLISFLTSATKLTGILVKMGPNETGQMYEGAINFSGGTGGDTMPPQVALLVRKGTEHGGRKAQGRWFIPGMPEAGSTAGGVWAGSYIEDAQDNLTNFLNALRTQAVPMVLLHSRAESGVPPYPVETLVAQATMATQRRRIR